MSSPQGVRLSRQVFSSDVFVRWRCRRVRCSEPEMWCDAHSESDLCFQQGCYLFILIKLYPCYYYSPSVMKTISADEEQYHYRKWKDGWSLKQGQISVGLSIWGLTENVFYFSWTPSLLQTPSIIQIIVSRRPNFAFSLNLGQMLFFLIHPSPQMTGFGPFDSEISTMSTVWNLRLVSPLQYQPVPSGSE